MIERELTGDITSPENRRHIIIAMNTELGELSALGKKFLGRNVPEELLKFGSVLVFQFDEERKLYMVVCHHLGEGGWKDSERYLRYGLDKIWANEDGETSGEFSIVRVGTGVVGKKYGADPNLLKKGINASFLPIVMFERPLELSDVEIGEESPINFLFGFSALPEKVLATTAS